MAILTNNMVSMINAHIVAEQYASLFYRSGANWADANGLMGVAHWLESESKDESEHRDGFMAYLTDADAAVITPASNAPPQGWASLGAFFEEALALETRVRRSIEAIYRAASEEQDFMTAAFLVKYLNGQRDAFATLTKIQAWLKRYGDDYDAIDRRIGEL